MAQIATLSNVIKLNCLNLKTDLLSYRIKKKRSLILRINFKERNSLRYFVNKHIYDKMQNKQC
jgi:hypothetical protein